MNGQILFVVLMVEMDTKWSGIDRVLFRTREEALERCRELEREKAVLNGGHRSSWNFLIEKVILPE